MQRGIVQYLIDREKQRGNIVTKVTDELLTQFAKNNQENKKTYWIKTIDDKTSKTKYVARKYYELKILRDKYLKEIRTTILVNFGYLEFSKNYHKLYKEWLSNYCKGYQSIKNNTNKKIPLLNQQNSPVRITTIKAFKEYIKYTKPIITNMYLPTSMYNSKDVLLRLPVPNPYRDAKLGLTVGIEARKMSLVTATTNYYNDIMLDQGQRIQLVTPIVAEVVNGGDETNLEPGTFISPKIPYWTPLMISEDLMYFYFIMGKDNLGCLYSQSQGEELFEKYRTGNLGGVVPQNATSQLGNQMGINEGIKTNEAAATDQRNFTDQLK
jgi:hypothetical protein